VYFNSVEDSMKSAFLAALMAYPLLAISSPSPTLLSEGQEITITGNLEKVTRPTMAGQRQAPPALMLHAREFFILRPGQPSPSSFEIVLDDPESAGLYSSLVSMRVTARCVVSIPAGIGRPPQCITSKLIEYKEPQQKPKALNYPPELFTRGGTESAFVGTGQLTHCYGRRFEMKTVADTEILEVFYTTRACHLPIVNAQHMRRYEFFGGGIRADGCWAELLGGNVAIIGDDGSQETRPKLSLNRVQLFKDGTGKVLSRQNLEKPNSLPAIATGPDDDCP